MRSLAFYRKLITASAMLALILIVFVAGYVLGVRSPASFAQAQDQQPVDTEQLFQPFWEAWNLLHENYVDPLDDNTLMQGALSGMMDSVGDPHTDYMDPETYAHVNEAMSGEYEGIGATVRQDETTGGLELVSIMDGSPAQKAGLIAGDQIIEVNGENITDLSQNDIIAQVRGPAGTTVHLGIQRVGKDSLLQFDVTRDKITVPSVTYKVLDGDIGYVRLSQFEFSSSQEMRDALQSIDADHLNGLILDVRGNPGGYLTTAIEVASAYIPQGTIVIERGPNREHTYKALENAIAPDVPMVVLVDQGSASASELIAGALQDNRRATIIGVDTFGKGSVQTWHDLSNGGGIRITVSRWYTPDGRSVSDVGIEPDIVVPFTPDENDPTADNQLQAAVDYLNGVPVPEQHASDPAPASAE